MHPDPFVDPLRFLSECHGRIRLRLEIFREAAAALRGEVPVAGHPIEAAILFFQTSGAAHTVDEESSLFPRLLRRLEALGDREALEQLAALEREHRSHEAAHHRVEQALRALAPSLGDGDGLPDPEATPLAAGTPEALEAAAALEELVEQYEVHIPIEDEQLFPLARRALPAIEIDEIAAEMRRRHSLGRSLL